MGDTAGPPISAEHEHGEIERQRESNTVELAATIPTRLKRLLEIFETRGNLEQWRRDLFVKITLNIVKVCYDLLRSTDEDALSGAAWNARNLLELWVWAKYCSASRENARRFHEDCLRDSQGLADSYFRMCDLIGVSRELESKMREDIQTVARTHFGVESVDTSYERVANAAATVGLDGWFKPCNAFLSKFAHPTAFLVVGVMHQGELKTDLQVSLTTQGIFYAHQSVAALVEMIESLGARL